MNLINIFTNKIVIAAIIIVVLASILVTFYVTSPVQSNTTITNQTTTPQPNQTVTQTKQILLIADTENQRVIQVSFDSDKKVEWQYGCSTINNLGKCSTDLLYRPTSAAKTQNGVVIADRMNNRVIEVSKDGEVLWAFDYAIDRNIWYPNYAAETSEGHILIADGFNHRVLDVDKKDGVVWSYGCSTLNTVGKCAYGTDPNMLRNPHMVERLSNGNTLITDTENSRIIEVDKDKNTVWELNKTLSMPYGAHKLSNGNVLIANTKANSVLEVDKDYNLVWVVDEGLYFPTDAVRLADGNTLIVDSYNNRVIEVNKYGDVIWHYGDGKFGASENQVGKPSTVAVI